MFRTAALAGLVMLAAPVAHAAEEAPELPIIEAGEHTLSEFKWEARPLVIFADSPNDPRYLEQLAFIADRPEPLIERDVVVITDTDPDNLSPIRKELRPRDFMIVLIGKDGQKYLRKPFPWEVRELTRSIDKMPVRLQEVQDQRLVR
ncbi:MULTISPECIES: DUF4174 domain-containing protein [Maritimibacter]|jgi:hypothetical protein|uniref:DUF4174 domain-containing protein n=1 Tax=Maritimibacter alkaliphilus HTCC2654 TaxID=314271 RepID=A3VHU9_9RHOB|nr:MULTISPECIES: DUF4174 domain-containing protein [Maritimibacter]EAQ12290.1 hypothetical protein RB2654_08792 [Rhodobacterales bacterium HTCC2654] [Maritimibacter alkaliphilus HTCC2654]MBL6428653.1 DUF4174 domain-containing protein [Maritimibacter sp.]TYP85423.1 uncharacterized protein DUF4174 [Maritimibacter alkaliphilus HTCC2654]